MCKSLVHLPARSMRDAITFSIKESDWSRKVNKVRKILVKQRVVYPNIFPTFRIFCIFPSLLSKNYAAFSTPVLPTSFIFFTFLDQSDSFVGKVVASRIDRAGFYGKGKKFLHIFVALSFHYLSNFMMANSGLRAILLQQFVLEICDYIRKVV